MRHLVDLKVTDVIRNPLREVIVRDTPGHNATEDALHS